MAEPFVITSLRGGINNSDPSISLPVDQVTDARNVEWVRTGLGRRRGGSNAISMTGSALDDHDMVTFLHSHFVTGDGADSTLWGLGCSADNSYDLEYKDTTWHAVVPVDDIDVTGVYRYQVRAISLHGKIFFAFKSAVDRLHVWDGTTLRRAGLAEPAAPSVADSAPAGTFTGLRYYRVRYVEVSGSTVLRRSEPSEVTEFTPSGTKTGAVLTKPAAINEGETHWEPEGSIDGANFYRLDRVIVATTTFTDTQDYVTGYASDFELSETVGDYELIGSARFLTADQDRLVFASDFDDEDEASIVGWTPVLNDPGNGNDERVPVSTTNTLNLDGQLGGRLTGLSNPVNGYIYAFKQGRVYKLVRTGIRTKAYEAVLLTDKRGAVEGSVVEGVDQLGNPCVYFIDPKVGPCRIGMGGIRTCGDDIYNTWRQVDEDADLVAVPLFYGDNKQVHWWIAIDSDTPDTHLMIQTNETREAPDGIRRGWSIWDGDSAAVLAAVMHAENIDAGGDRSNTMKPLVGRIGDGNIWQLDTADEDDNGAAFHAYMTTKPYAPATILNETDVQRGVLLGVAAEDVTVEITASANFGLFERAATASLSPEASETHVLADVDDLLITEMTTYELTFEDSSPATGQWDLHAFALAQDAGGKTGRTRA